MLAAHPRTISDLQATRRLAATYSAACLTPYAAGQTDGIYEHETSQLLEGKTDERNVVVRRRIGAIFRQFLHLVTQGTVLFLSSDGPHSPLCYYASAELI